MDEDELRVLEARNAQVDNGSHELEAEGLVLRVEPPLQNFLGVEHVLERSFDHVAAFLDVETTRASPNHLLHLIPG